MRAGEILDAQRDLIERLEGTKFHQVMAHFAAAHFGSDDGTVKPHIGVKTEGTNYAAADILLRQVGAAEAYRVSHDMCEMVEYASSQLEDLDRFDPSLAPTGCGIVCFDKPFVITDIRGTKMLMHWLVWGPGAQAEGIGGVSTGATGTILWGFNDVWRQPDEAEISFQDTMAQAEGQEVLERALHMRGRWGPLGASVAWDQQRLGPRVWEPTEEQAMEVIADGDTLTPGTNTHRLVMALWMLMDQTVTCTDREIPDRPALKRAKRARLPQEVTVIRLRREDADYEPHEGESLVEWRHRWIVRGHWRWQACGEGRQDRKRIWINPFVKGPQGLPIKQSQKVYSLER